MCPRFGTFLRLGILVTAVLTMSGCFDNTGPNFGGFFAITEDCGPDEFGIPFCVPHPNVLVNGNYVRDLDSTATGTVQAFPSQGLGYVTTDITGHYFVQYGRFPAVWNSGIKWNVPCGPSGATMAVGSFNVPRETPYIGWACGPGPPPPPPQVVPTPQFSLVGSTPATITIPGTGLSTQYGIPQLYVYIYNSTSNTPTLVSQSAATAVSSDGTSATFNFPTASNGSALSYGVYKYGLWNQTASGALQNTGRNFFSLGSNSSMTTPFGVDAVDMTLSGQDCYLYDPSDPNSVYCDAPYGPTTSPSYNITLSSLGQANTIGGNISVGQQPTAVKSYATVTFTNNFGYGGYQTITQPSRAIVTNFGSNTASILDLVNGRVVTTIALGTQPLSVVLNSSQSTAYAANYGSSTVSEIDLNSNTQTRVTNVGALPEALAMDPSGTALWVGGQNYISKLDLNSLSAIQSFSVSGQVTLLAGWGGAKVTP